MDSITLVFDKGNNSSCNIQRIDESPYHFVGSLKLSEVENLLEVPLGDYEDLTVCRECRMTCRLKSDRGNSAVHPRSLRKMQGVIRSIKFSDKGSISESSKPAGCSESEPIRSLVT